MTRRIVPAILMLVGTAVFIFGVSRPWTRLEARIAPQIVGLGTVHDLRIPAVVAVLIILVAAALLLFVEGGVYRVLGFLAMGAVALLAFALNGQTSPMIGNRSYEVLDWATVALSGLGLSFLGGLIALLLPPHRAGSAGHAAHA
jgi:hypothetical protein